MKARLFIVILASILMTIMVLPTVPVYADEPVVIDLDKELFDEWSGYKIYFNDVTREYQFIESDLQFWETRQIPESFKPSDALVIDALDKIGVSRDDVHISQDYSAAYPTAITYKDVNSDTYIASFSGLPQVTSNGYAVDTKWYKTVDNVYVSGNNWYSTGVDGTQITVLSDEGIVTWTPQLFLNGIEQYPSGATILGIDSLNDNYSGNVLEWDYGVAKRWVRLIEGIISERWIVPSNPYGEIRIKHNAYGTMSLPLVGSYDASDKIIETIITDDEEIVSASSFNSAVYPVVIGASPLTVFSSTSDGYNWNVDAVYATAHDAASADGSDPSSAFLVHQQNFAGGNYQPDRVYTYFDTSSIGIGATITIGVFSLRGRDVPTENDATYPDVGVVEGVQADPFTDANYGDHLSKTTLGAPYVDVSVAWNGIYNTFTLNATGRGWISLTGTTLFCTRTRGDIDNLVPTGVNDTVAESSEVGAGFQPRLVVTYTALPTVTSQAATNVEETSATLNGNVTNVGSDATVDQRGFVYDTSTHADPGNVAPPATYASSWADAGGPWGTGAFDSGANVTGLTKGELYFYRAYTHNSQGYDYSNTERTFLTKPDEPTALTATSTGDGEITVAWTTGTGFDQTRVRRKVGAYPANELDGVLAYTAGGVSFVDSGLTGGLTYYYRAWSWTTEGGLEQYSDAFAQDNEMVLSSPTIQVYATDNITVSHSGTFNAGIVELGGYADATDRGFVWDTVSHGDPGAAAPPATYANSWTENGSFGIANYWYNITGLNANDTYYVRAVAQNTMGWDYSAEISFDTFDSVLLYQPITIIAGTTLPDREGNEDGIFTFGANPGGVSVTMSGLALLELPVALGEDLTTPDVSDNLTPDSFMYPSSANMTMSGNLFFPIIFQVGSLSDTPINLIWWGLCAMLTVLMLAITYKYSHNLILAGAVALMVEGAFIAMTGLPWWFLIVGAIGIGGLATMERTPSL